MHTIYDFVTVQSHTHSLYKMKAFQNICNWDTKNTDAQNHEAPVFLNKSSFLFPSKIKHLAPIFNVFNRELLHSTYSLGLKIKMRKIICYMKYTELRNIEKMS